VKLGCSSSTSEVLMNIFLAPLFEPDADDTAKGISALSLLGKEICKDSLVQNFEQAEWFKTFRQERNPSFSANCNILSALTSQTSGPQKYAAQIGKITRFLCKSWLNNTNVTQDKWVNFYNLHANPDHTYENSRISQLNTQRC
jgi:hypothetical protein